MKITRIAVALALSSVATAWQPAQAEPGDWYLGLGAGRSQSKLDDDRLARELSAPGFVPSADYRHDHGDAFKGFAGYRLSKYFALEGSYFDLGKFTFFAPTIPSGSVAGTLRVRGFGLDAIGRLPFTDRFFAFAKIGASDAQTRDSFVATAANSIANPDPRRWRVNPKAGAGLQYAFTPHFALRGEWERYRIADAVRDHGNVDAWFVSLVFPLGHTPAPMPAAPPPAAMVDTPPPAVAAPLPPPPAPAAPPPPRRVNFNADALFSFDRSTLRPEGTRELDKFVSELRGLTYERIHVIGYTDRIGSDAYNLRLSQQRADAVKDYLTRAGGLGADRVSADGRGKADPVTQPGACPGKRSAATIACLQPDRRVEIEVAGTQR